MSTNQDGRKPSGDPPTVRDSLHSAPCHTPIGAGGAFLREVRDGPDGEEAMGRIQRRIRDILGPGVEILREAVAEANRRLESDYFPVPKSIEDYEHLARVIEMPLDKIESGEFTAREVYAAAAKWANEHKAKADRDSIQDQYKEDARAGVESSKPPRRKHRGRKRADYETEKQEQALADAWDQAREQNVCKADFAKQCEYTLREFDKLLNRVRKRNKRSDK